MNKYYQRHTDSVYQILVASSKETIEYCEEQGYKMISAKDALRNWDCMAIANDGQELFWDLLPLSEKKKRQTDRASEYLLRLVSVTAK